MIDNVFNELIGKMITGVSLSENNDLIEFVDETGNKHPYETCGDCCNEVWFNHVSGLDFLLGHVVLMIDIKEWINVDSTRQEYEQACFITFHTTGGYFDLEFRNSSNGFYGGDISKTSSTAHSNMFLITDDF